MDTNRRTDHEYLPESPGDLVNYLATSDRFYGDVPGGSYKIAWEVAKLMRDRGHSVSMLCGSVPSDPPPGPSEVEEIRIIRYRFPDTPPWDPLRLRRHVHAARAEAVRWLGDTAWDVVHAHVPAGALAVFGVLPGDPQRIYSIHSPHVLEQRINWDDGTLTGQAKIALGMPVMRRGEYLAYAGAQRLSAESHFTRSAIETLFGPQIGSRIEVIPWWAERATGTHAKSEARRLLGWMEDGPVLLSLRRMVPRMGLSTLLEAVEPLAAHHKFRLVLAGEGPERRRLEEQAARGRAAHAVSFTGRLTDEEVALAYEAVDLFVLPTASLECFGIIAVDAYAYGVPVIASRVGAIPEVVGPISPGCLFPAGDVVALRGLLRRFFDGELPLPDPSALISYANSRYCRQEIEQAYLNFIRGQN